MVCIPITFKIKTKTSVSPTQVMHKSFTSFQTLAQWFGTNLKSPNSGIRTIMCVCYHDFLPLAIFPMAHESKVLKRVRLIKPFRPGAKRLWRTECLSCEVKLWRTAFKTPPSISFLDYILVRFCITFATKRSNWCLNVDSFFNPWTSWMSGNMEVQMTSRQPAPSKKKKKSEIIYSHR